MCTATYTLSGHRTNPCKHTSTSILWNRRQGHGRPEGRLVEPGAKGPKAVGALKGARYALDIIHSKRMIASVDVGRAEHLIGFASDALLAPGGCCSCRGGGADGAGG